MADHLGSDSHPVEADLVAFAVGRLPTLRAELIELHVTQCEQCAATVAKSPRDPFIERLRAAQRARQPVGAGPSVFQEIANDETPKGDGSETRGDPNFERLPPALRQHPRYRIIHLLARGGMGDVYLAEHRTVRNLVALKTIKPELATDRDSVLRFLQEARLAGKLAHLNIARVLDAEEVGETAFMAIEYIEGKTLAQIVAKRGPLSVEHASNYIRQVALGLNHAHRRGVIHRDIKPQNVMLAESNGIVKILDFGLGRLTNDQRSRAGLTREGDRLGTPDYMAPEQVRDARSATIVSDIYSLGCTFYFLLTGRPPFAADSILELLSKHETERATPIGSLRPDVPANITGLIERMMAKEPRHRPQTPQEVAAALSPRQAIAMQVDQPQPRLAEASSSAAPAFSALAFVVPLLSSPLVFLPLLTLLISLIVLLVM